MPFPSPVRALDRLRQQGFASSLLHTVHRLHAEYWDWKLRIHSFGGYQLESEGIVDHDDHGYSPESYLDFRRALRWLTPDERRGAFLDCGSGKGRIVLAATQTDEPQVKAGQPRWCCEASPRPARRWGRGC